MPVTYTPGPWAVNGREVNGPPDSGVIVACLPEWGVLADGPDAAPANARLIASAPELLESVRSLLNYANLGAYDRADAVKTARAAIRKATGA